MKKEECRRTFVSFLAIQPARRICWATPGLQINPARLNQMTEPIHYYKLSLTDQLVEEHVRDTKLYVENRPSKRRSRHDSMLISFAG